MQCRLQNVQIQQHSSQNVRTGLHCTHSEQSSTTGSTLYCILSLVLILAVVVSFVLGIHSIQYTLDIRPEEHWTVKSKPTVGYLVLWVRVHSPLWHTGIVCTYCYMQLYRSKSGKKREWILCTGVWRLMAANGSFRFCRVSHAYLSPHQSRTLKFRPHTLVYHMECRIRTPDTQICGICICVEGHSCIIQWTVLGQLNQHTNSLELVQKLLLNRVVFRVRSTMYLYVVIVTIHHFSRIQWNSHPSVFDHDYTTSQSEFCQGIIAIIVPTHLSYLVSFTKWQVDHFLWDT